MFGAEVRVGAGRGLRRTARIRGPSRVAAASSHPSSRPPPRAAYMFNPFPAHTDGREGVKHIFYS